MGSAQEGSLSVFYDIPLPYHTRLQAEEGRQTRMCMNIIILTPCGLVTQICVYALQLWKMDDAHMRLVSTHYTL